MIFLIFIERRRKMKRLLVMVFTGLLSFALLAQATPQTQTKGTQDKPKTEQTQQQQKTEKKQATKKVHKKVEKKTTENNTEKTK
jgi:Ni/Co efflux regulator RcnB